MDKEDFDENLMVKLNEEKAFNDYHKFELIKNALAAHAKKIEWDYSLVSMDRDDAIEAYLHHSGFNVVEEKGFKRGIIHKEYGYIALRDILIVTEKKLSIRVNNEDIYMLHDVTPEDCE